MEQSVVMKIAKMAEEPAAVERSIRYIADNMGLFLKKKERVLILFPREDSAACHILEQAVLLCECTPLWIGDDWRWMTLLKTAFTTRCNCIIGPPLMLLGLSKVAKHRGTPLFARNILLSGYPSTEWLVKGVEQGLDCQAWGCYDPGIGAVIGGFSCRKRVGVHLRTEEYGVDIEDDQGRILPAGEPGNVVLYPTAAPTLRFHTGDKGRLDYTPCSCGCTSPRLLDLDTIKGDYQDISSMGERLHYWSSVLDCRLEKTECGLELELIVFQGEKLPKLPTAAKLVIRPFEPDKDEPFAHHEVLKKRFFSAGAH